MQWISVNVTLQKWWVSFDAQFISRENWPWWIISQAFKHAIHPLSRGIFLIWHPTSLEHSAFMLILLPFLLFSFYSFHRLAQETCSYRYRTPNSSFRGRLLKSLEVKWYMYKSYPDFLISRDRGFWTNTPYSEYLRRLKSTYDESISVHMHVLKVITVQHYYVTIT